MDIGTIITIVHWRFINTTTPVRKEGENTRTESSRSDKQQPLWAKKKPDTLAAGLIYFINKKNQFNLLMCAANLAFRLLALFW